MNANDKKIQNRFKLHEITMMLVGATFLCVLGLLYRRPSI